MDVATLVAIFQFASRHIQYGYIFSQNRFKRRKSVIFPIPTYSPIFGQWAEMGIIGTICTENTVIFTATFWLQKLCGRGGLPE